MRTDRMNGCLNANLGVRSFLKHKLFRFEIDSKERIPRKLQPSNTISVLGDVVLGRSEDKGFLAI